MIRYKVKLYEKRFSAPEVPFKLAVPAICEGKCIRAMVSSHLHPKVRLWRKRMKLRRIFQEK